MNLNNMRHICTKQDTCAKNDSKNPVDYTTWEFYHKRIYIYIYMYTR